MKVRLKLGGSALLVVVLALVLIIVGTGLFFLTMFFGGERQLKNANDAGALNAAKEVVDDGVVLIIGSDESKFQDVAGYSATLTNINRIWAKAMLIALNAQTMQEGQDNVNKLYTAAQSLTTRLAMQVRSAEYRKKFYMTYARVNPLTMLGPKGKLDTTDLSDWSHSYMDRGEESNVSITPGQLPVGLGKGVQIPTLAPDKKDPKKTYLVGYKPYEIGGKKYWQVPFKLNERPQLVSVNEFEKDRLVPPAWLPVALPNAFSAVGKSKNSADLTQTAKSWAQANPDKTFKAAIPSGFVRVILKVPTYRIRILGFRYKSGKASGFKPFTMNFNIPKWPLWYAMLCGRTSVDQKFGLEYSAPLLHPAMFGIPPYRKSKAFANILQRVQQINPDCTEASLKRLLFATPISTAAKDQEYIICNTPDPRYKELYSPDPKLVCVPASLYRTLSGNLPDGQRKQMEEENAYFTNFGLIFYFCAKPPIPSMRLPTVTNTETRRIWQPGTGYTRCLGTLVVEKETKVDIWYAPCVCWP